MIHIMPMCMACTRYNDDGFPMTCKAYPDGIPEEVLNSSIDHREPYDDDQGIVFEQIPDMPAPHVFKLNLWQKAKPEVSPQTST